MDSAEVFKVSAFDAYDLKGSADWPSSTVAQIQYNFGQEQLNEETYILDRM